MRRAPQSLSAALERLAQAPDLLPVAGCTDLMVTGSDDRSDHGYLNLLAIEELHGIEVREDHLRIGATTTFARLRAASANTRSASSMVVAMGFCRYRCLPLRSAVIACSACTAIGLAMIANSAPGSASSPAKPSATCGT